MEQPTPIENARLASTPRSAAPTGPPVPVAKSGLRRLVSDAGYHRRVDRQSSNVMRLGSASSKMAATMCGASVVRLTMQLT